MHAVDEMIETAYALKGGKMERVSIFSPIFRR
jgi:hypothetical protein